MFPAQWDDGYGQGQEGQFMFSMTDKLQIPSNLEPGDLCFVMAMGLRADTSSLEQLCRCDLVGVKKVFCLLSLLLLLLLLFLLFLCS